MTQTPSSGPSASASSQGCFMLWSTFTAWTSSTATSRGERGGLDPAKGSGCRDETGPHSRAPFLSLCVSSLCLSLPTSPPLGLPFFVTSIKISVSVCCQHKLPTCHHICLSKLVFPQQAPHTHDIVYFPPVQLVCAWSLKSGIPLEVPIPLGF